MLTRFKFEINVVSNVQLWIISHSNDNFVVPLVGK
jgi:hypothetical protein